MGVVKSILERLLEAPEKPPDSLRHVQDHLRILQVMYAVFFTLGLVRVADAAREPFFSLVSLDFSRRVALELLAAMAILLLGLRLFFAVEELSRYLIQRLRLHPSGGDPPASWPITLFHYPMLFMHAFMYYSICALFQPLHGEFQNIPAGASLASIQLSTDFVYMYGLLMLLNVVWLASFLRTMSPRSREQTREKVWISLNLLAAIVALVASRGPQMTGIGFFSAVAIFSVLSVIDLGVTANQYVPQE